MVLFRAAVVVGLAIAVMPADEKQQQQLYDSAAQAAHWSATFCVRNHETCTQTAAAWDTFVKKAAFAGQLAYDISEVFSDDDGSSSYGRQARASPASGTLTADDLTPPWGGGIGFPGI